MQTPPLAAKINCSPSPCIVSPSVSLSGERASSPALSSFPCVLFKISANEIMAHAWVEHCAKTAERWFCVQQRAAGSHHAPCDSVLPFIPLMYSNSFGTHGPGGTRRAYRGHRQVQVDLLQRFCPCWCPRQSSSITWSSIQLFQNGCFCVSVCLVSEDWAREEICAAANAYRLGLERELQRWGLCH